jgi:peptidyl-prolyl cis-trans isomerase B (cyclophilin B)
MIKRKTIKQISFYSVFLLFGLLTACGSGGGGGAAAPTNSSPSSVAGPDQTVLEGSEVALSGSASDSDGSISSTQWQQTGGTDVSLTNDATLNAGFTAPEVGASTTLTFTLTATDNSNATTVDTTTVTILPNDNNRVLLGPLIGANVAASRSSNPAGVIESTTTSNVADLDLGATFSLALEGIAINEWVLTTASGGTDIDADDDGVLDVVPTLNTGNVRALGTAGDWRTNGTNINILSEIAVRRLLNGGTNIDSLGAESIEIQLTGLAHELLANDINADNRLDYKDILSFRPIDATSLNMNTFSPVEITAIAQVLEAGDDLQVTALVEAAFTFSTFATIKTNLGDFKLELFPELVPNTVNNFVVHARDGFYDGLIFHRVIPSFVVQSGDPNGNGTGGASIIGGSFDDEFDESLSNVQGTIAMANSGPNTNGSQFYLNVVDNTGLDFNKSPLSSAHSVFGRITEGADVLLAISNSPTDGQDRPATDVIIETITISR